MIAALIALLVLVVVLGAPFALMALLRPALACVDGGSRHWRHVLAALVAGAADVLAAHTTWALWAGRPQRGEWTISHTLERLRHTPGPRRALYQAIVHEVNRVSPTGAHFLPDTQPKESPSHV